MDDARHNSDTTPDMGRRRLDAWRSVSREAARLSLAALNDATLVGNGVWRVERAIEDAATRDPAARGAR